MFINTNTYPKISPISLCHSNVQTYSETSVHGVWSQIRGVLSFHQHIFKTCLYRSLPLQKPLSPNEMILHRLVSLTALAASVYAASVGTSTGDIEVTDAAVSGSYIDVEMLDPTASNGTVNVKVPLAGFSKDLYSSLVSGAENAPSSAACIPKGEFCTWGYWDCCGSAGCLLVGIVGGVCT
ncbi:hypothetical protein LENED_008329 [Lentinula edodes]|uniref:Uncharacterized protein n=1 Tax=Lentinula edodes TaxID=5353 RepID=A0A1Q3EGS9_LENED|nr:hypothetical protein LENED_008329 [Lentinula edodes]